ncbi:MAG: PEP-CTERM sorting domain-containing protein [Stigonema ocellatum SAG 48.90 = DSM 106950]|nr:PEP-CTERM sorting domain-containing protein [Stigonema ocellatum SAG 48.90 = DSM 106950]
MRNSLSKAAAFAATTASILATISATMNPAQATDFNFSWKGDNGYSATGSFSYDETKAPEVISESGAGQTQYLQSLSVSFFDPAQNLLESGSSVVNGVSSDRFLRLDFDTQSQKISTLDTDIGGTDYQYFLTNLRTPSGQVVEPGITNFNLFSRPNGTPLLDSSSTVQVTKKRVPEPTTIIGTLVAGGLSIALKRKS